MCLKFELSSSVKPTVPQCVLPLCCAASVWAAPGQATSVCAAGLTGLIWGQILLARAHYLSAPGAERGRLKSRQSFICILSDNSSPQIDP